jgi:FMN phosphatase YigB (HAD superfamily)
LFCRWANEAVSPNIVQAVLNAWEMERHHAAERHLYPDVMEALAEIKRDHPDVIIGAVTDGRANPLFMTFTLAKYFDFCISWEDDQAGRQKFFQDLGQVDASAELKWIYDAALEKYTELATAAAVLHQQEFNRDNKVWIHVGDDLGLDCGGAAQSGAKTIYLELAEKYGQTARQRFAKAQSDQPTWSTTSKQELETRRVLNEAAEDKVDKKINFITRLPEAVQDILDAERSKAKTFMKQEQEAK